jgi:phosphoribosyl-ATP pyrophosphohydrolase/phosphoribosyl-AMP cyclohydrolase
MKEVPDFQKGSGLLPAIVQDMVTGKVLMLGYMNQEALDVTNRTGKVTFFSRSKGRLWTKGETSGNYLELDTVQLDCDRDTLLVKAKPLGPTCHLGQDTCFGEDNKIPAVHFLSVLQNIIKGRKKNAPGGSYTAHLFASGINKIAQKVGEEAVEVVIEAKESDTGKLKEETADLLFHLLVLLTEKGVDLEDVASVLVQRHQQ